MRKICSMIIACFFVCGLLAGCGGSKIVVPFSSNRYQSLQYSDVVKQLEDAGFSNISALDVETDRESDSGRVFSISIDGDVNFSETSQFPADAPIVVKYYSFVSEPIVNASEPEPTPHPDQSDADRIGYPLEQYISMKEALLSCGVTESEIKSVSRIGTHEACLTYGNSYLTISFDNDGRCTRIYNADGEFYNAGEIVQRADDAIISDSQKYILCSYAILDIPSYLKSPDSAEFPSADSFSLWDVTKDSEYYYVYSYVDAQNSYGATIRTYFTATYEWNGNKDSRPILRDLVCDE